MTGGSTTSNRQRAPRLLPPSRVSAFGALIVCVLVVLAPARDEMEERIAGQKPDQLSLTYLQLAVRENPDDIELRLLLARQYYELSRYSDARRTLESLLGEDSPYGREARLLAIEIGHARCTGSLRETRDARCSASVARDIRALLGRGDALSDASLRRLAKIALANGAPGLSGDIYDRLADHAGGDEERATWRELAASAYVQNEQPVRAATMHAKSAREAPANEAGPLIERAVDYLREAERSGDALQLVMDELERAPESELLLKRAIALALEMNRGRLAAELGRRLLALGPRDAASLAEQTFLELAIGEVERALPLARDWVGLTPGDPVARKTLAQIADWTNRELVALENWAWLARRGGQSSYRERAIALARAQWDRELLLSLLLLEAQGNRAIQLEVAQLHSALGRPRDARTYLERLVAGDSDDRLLWDALLAVDHSLADFAAVADTWQRMERHVALSHADRREWATALWRDHRPEEALAVLVIELSANGDGRGGHPGAADVHGPADPLSSIPDESLRLVAELAWQLERMDVAHRAHAVLWHRDVATELELERLIIASYRAGCFEVALAVAEHVWRRTNEPRAMLRAMRIAYDAGLFDDLARLEQMVASDRAVGALADYWQLRIARRQHSLRMALSAGSLDQAQSILGDLRQVLIAGGHASQELIGASSYRELWADWYRQQLYVALERRDMGTVRSVLRTARLELENSAEYWQLRAMLHHDQLIQAITSGSFDRASAILDDMDRELDSAAERGFGADPGILAMREDVAKQRFYVAVARGDRDTALDLIDRVDVPALDRTRALERLGDSTRAIAVALDARASASDPATRKALDESIETNTQRLARQIGARVRMLELDGLSEAQTGVDAELTWQRVGVKASVTGSRLSRGGGKVAQEAGLRVAGKLLTRRTETEVGVGGNLRRDDRHAQLDISHTRSVGLWLAFGLRGGLGQIAEDDVETRSSMLRDYGAAWLSLGLGPRVFALAQLGSYRDRMRDGEALDGDALDGDAPETALDAQVSVGVRLSTGRPAWNVRLIGRKVWWPWAPIQTCDAPSTRVCSEMLPPEGSMLLALATSLSNVQPGSQPGAVATPIGRLRYSIDLVAGRLIPDQQSRELLDAVTRSAYSARLGLGIPLFGSDELSISAEISSSLTSNMALGEARRAAMLRYARSLW